jgi:hypothetical protein
MSLAQSKSVETHSSYWQNNGEHLAWTKTCLRFIFPPW